jgi:hypothetical protein
MSQNLSTPIRRIPLLLSVLVVLIIVLLLSISLLLSSGALRLGSAGGADPNGVTNGSMINPDGLASGCSADPNGGSCQSHAGGLLAAGVTIDGNGNT